ncbi:MAG: sugar ABC transporter ATP-binding protein [Ruthenibacterium sp.]
MEAIISCRNICKRFAGVRALDGVNLDLYPGEIHALIGENGAGKSTLIKVLSGIYVRDEGTILYNGKEVEIGTIEAAKRIGIAVIHQELSVVKALTAPENVFLGEEIIRGKFIKTLDAKRMREETRRILETLGVQVPLDVPAKELSIAQCQLIEIAKALKEHAKVLILDEPTTALTTDETEALFRVLKRLREEKETAILFVSHRLEEIYRISDKITVYRDGKFVGCEATAMLPQNRLISMMVGRELSDMYPKKQPHLGEVLLEVKHLRRKGAVQDASFVLHKGELLGIGGLMGAGRTELVRMLAGVDVADGGEILLNGSPLKLRHPEDAIAAGIVLVPEDRKKSGLFVSLSVNDNVSLPTLKNYEKHFQIDRKEEKQAVEHVIDKLSVKLASPSVPVKSLSGGNQQKIAIGKWLLLHGIRVFILDEPTRGVDVGAKFEIYKIMEDILEQGAAIIMVSSDLPELLAMSDRILVLREGNMMGELSHEEATEEKVMFLSTGGN